MEICIEYFGKTKNPVIVVLFEERIGVAGCRRGSGVSLSLCTFLLRRRTF